MFFKIVILETVHWRVICGTKMVIFMASLQKHTFGTFIFKECNCIWAFYFHTYWCSIVYKASTFPIYFSISATTTTYLTSVATSSFPHSLQLGEVSPTVVIARKVQSLPAIRPFPSFRRLGVPTEWTSQESQWETGGLQTLISWDVYHTLAKTLHTLPWDFWKPKKWGAKEKCIHL